jgi:hypothetical protein
MNFRRLFHSDVGKNIISIILGLGLATLFRKVCNDKNCIQFNGPIIGDIEDKTFKHGDKCYKYTTESDKCDSTKRIVKVISEKDAEEFKQ